MNHLSSPLTLSLTGMFLTFVGATSWVFLLRRRQQRLLASLQKKPNGPSNNNPLAKKDLTRDSVDSQRNLQRTTPKDVDDVVDKAFISLDPTDLNFNEDLAKLLGKFVPSLANKKIMIRELSDGMTNQLFCCRYKETQVLCRVYGKGTDKLIDRKTEIKNLEFLAGEGLVGKFYGQYANGIFYEFIPGRALKADEAMTYYPQIARLMAKWHKVKPAHLEMEGKTWLETVLDQWPDQVEDHLRDENYENIVSEISKAKLELSDINRKTFCHNDCNLANFILTPDNNLVLTDIEYAGLNYPAWDIANHFCEWSGVEMDYSKFPHSSLQYKFLQVYLTELNGIEPNTQEIKSLFDEVQLMVKFSHLVWYFWGKVQKSQSLIDMNFDWYTETRRNQFSNIKIESNFE